MYETNKTEYVIKICYKTTLQIFNFFLVKITRNLKLFFFNHECGIKNVGKNNFLNPKTYISKMHNSILNRFQLGLISFFRFYDLLQIFA